MDPYISGQNSAKFWGQEIYQLAETIPDGGGKKMFLQKLVLHYQFRC